MIHQTTVLLMNIKASTCAILGILLAFFLPIVPLLLIVGAAIALDTIFGIVRAKKLGEPVTSRKMSKLISKMVLYNAAVVLFFCIERYILGGIIGAFTEIPLILTKLVTATLLFIEITSISESYEAITGVSLWGKFKAMVARTKEIKGLVKSVKEDTKPIGTGDESNI